MQRSIAAPVGGGERQQWLLQQRCNAAAQSRRLVRMAALAGFQQLQRPLEALRELSLCTGTLSTLPLL